MARKDMEDDSDFKQLRDDVERSRKAMEHSKTEYQHDLKNLAGSHAYSNGSDVKRPVNFTELGATTWMQNLAAGNPSVMIDSPIKALRPYASDFEAAVNHNVRRMDLVDTIQDCILGGIFSPLGIIKHGLTESGDLTEGDERVEVGEPFIDPVSYDDFVLDMDAPSIERAAFMGDETYELLSEIKASSFYDKEVTKDLTYDAKPYDPVGGIEKAANISRSDNGDAEESTQRIRVMHLWVRAENKIYHYIADSSGGSAATKPLKVQNYKGPTGGPYRILRLAKCPDQILPPPPVTLWRDLDEAGNKIMNKILLRAAKGKLTMAYEGGAEEDAERLRDSEDLQWVKVSSPKAYNPINMDMGDPNGQATLLYLRQMFSWFNGNIDALAGLSPQAETLGQDKLLSDSASKRIQYLSKFVYQFTAEIARVIGFYIWGDPLINLPLTKKLPGTDIEIPFNFTSASKKGRFLDYNFRIQPYSMRQQTPEQEFGSMMQVLTSVVLPLMPLAQQQGVSVSFEGLMRHIAKLLNQNFWPDILTFGQSIQPEQEMMGMGKPDETTRNYTRRSIPGSTMAGNEATMMSALLGQNSQPSRMAGLARMPG